VNTRRILSAAAVAPLVAAFVACSSKPNPPSPAPSGPAATQAQAGVAPPARGPAAAASASASVAAPKLDLREEDFVESDRSRDPFRSFASVFAEQAKTRVKSQRQVLLDKYSIDELKLVGLVTRADPPRAMLVDPTGKGWVVEKGQFIGRAEIVHSTGTNGADYEVNWRIDRIRDGDIVLVREDASHSDIPAATRVIALRAEKDNEGLGITN
jgi:type IV pilus assembly protein PilP